MNGREMVSAEKAIRESIVKDIERFQANFKNKKDIKEAIKIVERKN